jgi:hypothetical protein
LIYVTLGALIDVWTLVWYFTRDYELSRHEQFWVLGFLLTGLTLIILGLLLGRIGRAARQAELPPEAALRAEARIQETAAAHPPPTVVPAAPAVVAPTAAPANAPVAAPAAPPVPPGGVQPQRMM